MATSAQFCSSCKVNPCNPGFKWCQPCYSKSMLGHTFTKCKVCGNPPNPGFDRCEPCYQNDVAKLTPGAKMCLICYITKPEANMDLCKSCLASLDHPNNAQSFTQTICIQCNKNPANHGFKLCGECHRQNSHFPSNGFLPPMQYGSAFNPTPPYPQHLFPVPPQFQYGGGGPQNPIYPHQPQPTPEKTSTRMLLEMGSKVVKKDKTVAKEKEKPKIDRDDVYHCVCPNCYSDRSRLDLFYCLLCFEKVVGGDAVLCEECQNRDK